MTLIVQHSNVDARLGPLQKHLSIGRIHHLHHVNWGTEGDCNFGLLLTVWDRLLGTFQEKPSRADHGRRPGRRRAAEFPQELSSSSCFLPFHYKPGAGEPERYRKPRPTPATPAQEARRIVDAGGVAFAVTHSNDPRKQKGPLVKRPFRVSVLTSTALRVHRLRRTRRWSWSSCSLSIRNSIASMVPIGLRMRRST